MKPIIPFVVFAIFLNINSIAQVNTANSTTKKPQQINKKMTTSANPYFNKTSKEKIKIYLLEMRDKLLGELGNEEFSQKSAEYLQKMNIEVLTSHQLVDFDGKSAQISNLKSEETSQ